ncbi:MAG: tRNA-dihydrouridine synthase, partial [Microcystis aeruginosa]
MAIYSSPLKIGKLAVHSRVLQSPSLRLGSGQVSGVTDLVFRRLVRRFAPDSMLYTEMVNATEISQLQELPQLMVIGDKEQ